MLNLIVCPGFHVSSLTDAFVAALKAELHQTRFSSVTDYLIQVYPEDLIFQGLPHPSNREKFKHHEPVIFIGFSAGVIGAIAFATIQQKLGRSVLGLIALDGWGVPLVGDFPIYRFSHDEFTHQTTAHWGGERRFYADPPVKHLSLWSSPERVQGWDLKNNQRFSATALQSLAKLISEIV